MSTHSIYVGIDVSKAQFDLAVRPTGQTTHFANTPEGIDACVAWLTPSAPRLIVLEATGGRERDLFAALTCAGLAVAVINPRKGRDFAKSTGRLAKTDGLDAEALAHFGEALHPAPTRLKSEEHQRLEALVLRQRQLLAMRTMEKTAWTLRWPGSRSPSPRILPG